LLLPSLGAVVVTFLALSWVSRSDLRARFEAGAGAAPLSAAGTISLFGVLAAGTALIVTSSLRGPIGAVTLCAAVAVLVATLWIDRREPAAALAAVSWSILPLVAGLFVLVRGLEVSGTIDRLRGTLAALHALPPGVAVAAVAVATAWTANLTNNLPLGVIAGQALAGGSAADGARYGAAIGVDLGPNLSVTGSLATILWLAALRREGIDMGALQFLRLGAIVMPTALLAAVTLLLVTTR
jgi:arsenical pump membrane protein